MKFTSPITGNDCQKIIQKIPTSDVVNLYKSRKGISVKDEFKDDFIYLVEDTETGFEFFSPFQAGSEKFYHDFYHNVNYQQDKQEYHYAKNFINDGDEVLDVGCGTGNFSTYIPQAKFTGLELTQASVDRAQQKGLNVKKLTIQEFNEQNQKEYDVVTSYQVLEHVEDPSGFIEHCLKPLKKGGLLVLSVPNNDGYKFLEVNSHTNIPPHHISRWTLKTFVFIANKLNLDIYDYYYDSDTLKNYLRFGILNKFIGGKGKRPIVKWSAWVRFLDLGLNVFFHILKPIIRFNFPAITGHSLTVVLRKR
jgi:SAM-dependent methyltransferase